MYAPRRRAAVNKIFSTYAMKPKVKIVFLLLAAVMGWWWWFGRRPMTEGYTDDENDEWLEQRLIELHAHLSTANPDLAAKVSVVKEVNILRDPAPRKLPNGKIGYNSGKFKHSTGTMSVGGRDGHNRERSRGSMLMTLLHEMAHASIGPTNLAERLPHGEEWSGVWKQLLFHATQELGWEVEVRCAECTYYNMCTQQQCPGCKWIQSTCAPYQGGSPSDFKKKVRYAEAMAKIKADSDD